MTVADYLPLVEKIRKRITSWTGRFISYAGRVQLIKSVIMSLTNFWMAAFRLPGSCLKEIERLCSAFIWSGPEMKSGKAKLSWEELCKSKEEGGLGLRKLKDINMVSGLNLIWRITSSQPSLWVRWIQTYLIRKGSFWSVKENSVIGSWMWRKILKLREVAKGFHRMEINSGCETSFWYDNWSKKGRLKDQLGSRGLIDLGIADSATVRDVILSHRRRRHRVTLLNEIEDEIDSIRAYISNVDKDQAQWKHNDDKYRPIFSSANTWMQLRREHVRCDWSKSVWFKHHTPRYSFILWVAMHDRLATGERMARWNPNIDSSCSLCTTSQETRAHLFFECSYSSAVWDSSVRGLMKLQYTNKWADITKIASGSMLPKTENFLLRYTFEVAVHSIWRERNSRRHGDKPQDQAVLIRHIDKAVRNKITTIKQEGRKEFSTALRIWFDSRGSH